MVRHIEGHYGILRHIQALLRYYWSILSHVLIYSELCITLAYTTVPYSHLEPKTSSKGYQICKMIRYIQSPGIVRTVYSSIFNEIQGYSRYLRIFKDISAYAATFTGVQLRSVLGSPPLPFFENQKKCPDFG